ncbi:hypothetical protein [Glaciihabitans sp. dw_435]|uniref:hypothetical protein n=1 Tax=Glaciihabitans sp. dw_435 TaxID=2720081 RepID=UPI001BD5A258|nr:hypothetical protein [Glaciihabitans sp. dw_435]
MTPEERRDDAIARIIAAGASVGSIEPLAAAADPTVVVAYRVQALAPTLEVLAALGEVRDDTETDLTHLVPWPAPMKVETFDA